MQIIKHSGVNVIVYSLKPFSVLVFFVLPNQVAAIQAEVTKQQQESEEDLAKAEPALQAANAALNTLNRVRYLFYF